MYWAQRNERERIEAVNPNICGGSYELDSDECIVTRSVADARGNEVRTKDENGTEIQSNAYDENGLRIRSGSRDYCYADGMLIASGDTEYITDPYGNVVSAYSGDDYYVYSTDIQGSTVCITDGTDVRTVYEYSDFGEATVSNISGNVSTEIQYTGAVYDTATGMYYMNARYYEPETGRFISQDTYRGEDDDFSTWHLYAYCNNDPINYTDPDGHKRRAYDITNKLNKTMKKNATWLYSYTKRIKRQYYWLNWNKVTKPLKYIGTASVLNTFINKVKSYGEWDLKTQKKWQPQTYGYKWFKYKSKYIEAQDVGNIHFGFVGSVIFKRETLCAGAGLYQIYSGTSSKQYFSKYFDDPRDTTYIRYGNKLWKELYGKRVLSW